MSLRYPFWDILLGVSEGEPMGLTAGRAVGEPAHLLVTGPAGPQALCVMLLSLYVLYVGGALHVPSAPPLWGNMHTKHL